jgi:hypothetical protein
MPVIIRNNYATKLYITQVKRGLLLVEHLIMVFMERKCLTESWTNLPNLSRLMDYLRMLFLLSRVSKL